MNRHKTFSKAWLGRELNCCQGGGPRDSGIPRNSITHSTLLLNYQSIDLCLRAQMGQIWVILTGYYIRILWRFFINGYEKS